MHAVVLKKLEDLETTGERCARVCYVGSWPCLSHITFAKTLFAFGIDSYGLRVLVLTIGMSTCLYEVDQRSMWV